MEQLDERCVLKIALIMGRIKRDESGQWRKKRRFSSDRSSANGFSFFLSFSGACVWVRWLALRCRRRVSFASNTQNKPSPRKSPVPNRRLLLAGWLADVPPPAIGESDYSNVQRVRQFANAKTHTRSSAAAIQLVRVRFIFISDKAFQLIKCWFTNSQNKYNR